MTNTAQADGDYDVLLYQIGSYHYNWHHELEILWLLTGEIEANVDGQRTHLQAGDWVAINSNVGHATFALQPESLAMRVHLTPHFFAQQGAPLAGGRIDLARGPQTGAVPAQLRACLAQLGLPGNRLVHTAAAYQLAALLYSHYYQPSTATAPAKVDNPVLKRATEYVTKHYADELKLDQLAARYNYSVAYLSRLFKNALGINFYEFLVRCRLQHAVHDLTHTQDLIVDIAYRNGFHEVKAFNAMFKKHFGKTPSAYRQSVTDVVLAEDSGFKKTLSPQAQARVAALLQTQQQLAQDPCAQCGLRADAAKYQQLVATISPLLDRKN